MNKRSEQAMNVMAACKGGGSRIVMTGKDSVLIYAEGPEAATYVDLFEAVLAAEKESRKPETHIRSEWEKIYKLDIIDYGQDIWEQNEDYMYTQEEFEARLKQSSYRKINLVNFRTEETE